MFLDRVRDGLFSPANYGQPTYGVPVIRVPNFGQCASSLFRTHWKRFVLKRVRRSKWLLAALCRASRLRLRFEC